MPKNDQAIHGSKLSRAELEPLLPDGKPIPFVFVYSCALALGLSQDEASERVQQLKHKIPDFKGVVNNNAGTQYDSLIVMFTRSQWALEFRFRDGEVWAQLEFRNHGKDWGSNYALWLRHLQWITEDLGAALLRDLMDHVQPADLRLPRSP